MEEDFAKLIEDYKPDTLIMSSTEDTILWELGIKILDEAREYKTKNNIPVLAGGVFPTFAPEICIKYDMVDTI